MSPRVPTAETIGRRDLVIDEIYTSSGKFPDRPKKWPPPQATEAHARELLEKLNRLQLYWERLFVLSSGYRPAAVNANVKNAAKRSLHIICAAADIADPTGALAKFCLDDLPMLEHIGLWMESPSHTKGWVHLQIFPPKSGNRVFIP